MNEGVVSYITYNRLVWIL